MPNSKPDFNEVFSQLKKILQKYEKRLTVTASTKTAYSLEGGYSEKFKRQLFFGSVQFKKSYVSFYLMPIYMFPELVKDISPELKKRMQGKSCFNFKQVDKVLFTELAELTKKSVARVKQEKLS